MPETIASISLGMVGAFMGVIVGGLITWRVTARTAGRAHEELRSETRDLRRSVNVLLVVLQEGRGYEVQVDADGELKQTTWWGKDGQPIRPRPADQSDAVSSATPVD